MNDMKYSVLMSVYFKESPENFRVAMDSMLNQTVMPDEIVLVEDGSLTDELYALIDEYKSKYPDIMHIVVNENNLGLGLSLKKGLNACKNELVARMDTDDISVPDRCEKQLEYFKANPDTSILGGQIQEFINTVDNVAGRRIVPETDSELKEYMKKRCPLNHVAVMFKKSDIKKAGNYKKWFWNEDYYLWIRLALKGCKFANLPDVLVNVRVGEEMYQRRGGMRYFRSEAKLQKYMLDSGLIDFRRYAVNVAERLILQVLMPNKVRGFIFRTLARK